jgi:hypothetical protein
LKGVHPTGLASLLHRRLIDALHAGGDVASRARQSRSGRIGYVEIGRRTDVVARQASWPSVDWTLRRPIRAGLRLARVRRSPHLQALARSLLLLGGRPSFHRNRRQDSLRDGLSNGGACTISGKGCCGQNRQEPRSASNLPPDFIPIANLFHRLQPHKANCNVITLHLWNWRRNVKSLRPHQRGALPLVTITVTSAGATKAEAT